MRTRRRFSIDSLPILAVLVLCGTAWGQSQMTPVSPTPAPSSPSSPASAPPTSSQPGDPSYVPPVSPGNTRVVVKRADTPAPDQAGQGIPVRVVRPDAPQGVSPGAPAPVQPPNATAAAGSDSPPVTPGNIPVTVKAADSPVTAPTAQGIPVRVVRPGEPQGISPRELDAAAPATEIAAPGESPVVLAPALGRPVFVEAGRTFAVRAVGGGNGVRYALRRGSRSIELTPANDAGAALAAGRPAILTVPTDTLPGTYDVVATTSAGSATVRACVAVRAAAGAGGVVAEAHASGIRLVQLSDLDLGGVLNQEIDPRLAGEINLLNPTAVICTGNYVDPAAADAAGQWQRLLEFFGQLEAPVILACGERDDVSLFTAHTGASPVGVVELPSGVRVLVLYDTPRAPLDRDAEQVLWAASELARPASGEPAVGTRKTVMVSNARREGWPEGLAEAGGTERGARRLLVTALDPREAGAGSAYRVFDLSSSDATVMSTPSGALPVGRLGFEAMRIEDQPEVRRVAAWNRHDMALPALQARVLAPKSGDQRPWCLGGRLLQVVDGGAAWECVIAFDLPASGRREMLCGVGQPPVVPDVRVTFDTGAPAVGGAADAPRATLVSKPPTDPHAWPTVAVENTSKAEVTVTPVMLLDAEPVAYTRDDARPSPTAPDGAAAAEAGPAPALELRLAPGEVVRLRPEITADRVGRDRPAPVLQVYLRGLPVLTPYTWTR